MMTKIILVCWLWILNITLCAAQTSLEGKLLSLESSQIEASDGKTYTGEWGRLEIPEFSKDPNSNLIQISFFRLKAKHSNPLPPIFILDGGPGDTPSTIQNMNRMVPILSMFNQRNDVVVVEQRGNGINTPNLTCPGSFNLPLDLPLSIDRSMSYYRKYVANCRDYWESQNVNLKGYNVIALSDDTDMVRRILGYEKIMLFGGSFGSHHALTYLKKYPDQVDRVLLTLPEGMNHTVKYPMEVDKVLRQLSLLSSDGHPAYKGPSAFSDLVESIIKQLEQHPVKAIAEHPETGEPTEIVLGGYDLQLVTALELGRIGYRSLPQHYQEMNSGDYSWLANSAINLRINQTRNLMAVLTDCASGATSDRWKAVKQQGKKAILGDALNDINFGACDLLGFSDIGDLYRVNYYSTVPMLVIYGTQDARTPKSNAQELKPYFSHARFIEVQNGSHDLFQEAFSILAPYLIDYLSAVNIASFEAPETLTVPLDLTQN
ncbi:MAG: hypothetical protein DHS20C17_27950 [Cyclobacteriaceae bacterium]|nr:MAG: hypothetical protein DHS20C17_27950 [Cyclobacteriaceae bacterium]